MAVRAIRVLVNDEEGNEHGLGINLDEFDPAVYPKCLAHLFQAAADQLNLDVRVVVKKGRNKPLPPGLKEIYSDGT